jgi:hypothetical protein
MEPRCYIVRIYRQGYRSLVGAVEDLSTQGRATFHDVDELIARLRTPIARECSLDGENHSSPIKKETS